MSILCQSLEGNTKFTIRELELIKIKLLSNRETNILLKVHLKGLVAGATSWKSFRFHLS